MKRWHQFTIASMISWGMLCRGPRASAQSSPPSSPESPASRSGEAKQRFQRGVELYREGAFDAALAEFRRAYDLVPNYRVLYNEAQVQIERHDALAALQLFTEYLERGGSEIDSERRIQIERASLDLRRRVAQLRVSSNVPGAELRIDGTPAGQVPLAAGVWVNAGAHNLTLKKEGYSSAVQNVSVAGGMTLAVVLELTPETAHREENLEPHGKPAAPPHRPERVGPGVGFWVSAASAGAFAGAATAMGILASRENRKLDQELQLFPADPTRIAEERSRVKTFALLTDGFGAAALLGAGLSVYFAIRGSQPDSSFQAPISVGMSGTAIWARGEF